MTNSVSVREAEELTRQAAPVARGGGGGALRSLGRRRGRDARDDGHEKRRCFFFASRRARVFYVVLRRSLALRLKGVGAAGPGAARIAARPTATIAAPPLRARERGEQSSGHRRASWCGRRGADHPQVGFGGDERRVVRVVGVAYDASGVAAAARADLRAPRQNASISLECFPGVRSTTATVRAPRRRGCRASRQTRRARRTECSRRAGNARGPRLSVRAIVTESEATSVARTTGPGPRGGGDSIAHRPGARQE